MKKLEDASFFLASRSDDESDGSNSGGSSGAAGGEVGKKDEDRTERGAGEGGVQRPAVVMTKTTNSSHKRDGGQYTPSGRPLRTPRSAPTGVGVNNGPGNAGSNGTVTRGR